MRERGLHLHVEGVAMSLEKGGKVCWADPDLAQIKRRHSA